MPKKETTLPRLLTHEQVAEWLGVSPPTIRRLRYEGELTTVRIRGQVRIPRESVEDYIERHTEN